MTQPSQEIKRIETSLPEVCVIEPVVFSDTRGFFYETYHEEKFARLGIRDRFVQDNHARSIRGTLRGLHYQITRPQAKLCRVVVGEVLDVVVDVRRGSPDFGRYTTVILSSENKRQIYIPAGFAHGYLVLSDTAEFIYKCSDFYFPEYDRGILWNDAELEIPWNAVDPIISPKDQKHPMLSEVSPEDLPAYD